jgi:photosystem II stability/assembly factor-like uncharacterized protein
MDGGSTWQVASSGIRLDPETRVVSLAIDPKNPNTLFAGTGGIGGGTLYKSTDAGGTWRDLDRDGLLGDGVNCLAFDPSNTRVIYAGTAIRGRVLKTRDGGANWVVSGLGETQSIINDILVDTRHPNVVLAAISFWGVWKSIDYGNTWNPFDEGLPNEVNGMKLALNPQSSELYLVGSQGDDGWVYRRRENDPSWEKIGISDLRVSYYYSDLKFTGDKTTLYLGTKGLYRLKLQ